MRLTALILDDEKSACEVMESMVTDYCPNIEILLVTQDPNFALDLMNTRSPDILFIDINMPKMSGFEFLNKLTDFTGKIIFTTAYDEFAIQAFKYSAFDYLLKPIHVEQLEETIERLQKEFKPKSNSEEIKKLVRQVNEKSTLTIPHNGGKAFVRLSDILFLQASGNYTFIHTEKQKFTAAKTLKEYEDILDDSVFIRIHKSYIVNIQKAVRTNANGTNNLILNSGDNVPISRRRKHLLNEFSL